MPNLISSIFAISRSCDKPIERITNTFFLQQTGECDYAVVKDVPDGLTVQVFVENKKAAFGQASPTRANDSCWLYALRLVSAISMGQAKVKTR